jgi:hypothetical protein
MQRAVFPECSDEAMLSAVVGKVPVELFQHFGSKAEEWVGCVKQTRNQANRLFS